MKKIKLTKNKHALIDDEDFVLINQYKWHAAQDRNTFYAATRINKISIKMHRLIMRLKYKDGKQIDHINGNGLDNRRNNLRLATTQQNCSNARPIQNRTSEYKGVHWCPRDKKWIANICSRGKKVTIGYFEKEKDAAKMYDKVAMAEFKEFACINFNKRNYNKNDILTIEEVVQLKNIQKIKQKTSKFIGVYFIKDRNKWRSVIYFDNKQKQLGYFDNEIEAAKAYDQWIIYNRMNKKLNFPSELE